MSEYDWDATVTLVVKAKTPEQFKAMIDGLKVKLQQLKDADTIASAKIHVSQKFKDRTWEIP